MGVILDTSAVIGLVELDADRPGIVASVRQVGGDKRPAIHVVTLGELAAGVHRAVEQFGSGSVEANARQHTLDVAAGREAGGSGRPRLSTFDIDAATWGCFGEISGPMGRRISNNDKWIVAAAIVNERVLITQDETLADRAGGIGVEVALVRRQPPDR